MRLKSNGNSINCSHQLAVDVHWKPSCLTILGSRFKSCCLVILFLALFTCLHMLSTLLFFLRIGSQTHDLTVQTTNLPSAQVVRIRHVGTHRQVEIGRQRQIGGRAQASQFMLRNTLGSLKSSGSAFIWLTGWIILINYFIVLHFRNLLLIMQRTSISLFCIIQ